MRILKLSVFSLLCAVAVGSCVKGDYDNPPDTSQYDPRLPVNSTIAAIAQSGLTLLSNQYRTLGDTTIWGIVVADDRSGNLYKKIFIVDSSGSGLELILDRSYLYGDYPAGRKIYVKLNGLVLFNYAGTPEIVASADKLGNTTGIPSALVNKYVIKASYPHTVTPTAIDATELFTNPYKYANTLVSISNMQFDDASKNVVYSNSSASTNRTLTTCDKTISLSLYNSSYATFAAAITPSGNGTISGVITIFNGKPEMLLRDTSDVRFTSPRCP